MFDTAAFDRYLSPLPERKPTPAPRAGPPTVQGPLTPTPGTWPLRTQGPLSDAPGRPCYDPSRTVCRGASLGSLSFAHWGACPSSGAPGSRKGARHWEGRTSKIT